jgi:hypothetical protein
MHNFLETEGVDNLPTDDGESKRSTAGSSVLADGEKFEFSSFDGSLGRRCCREGSWCLCTPDLGLGRGRGAAE